MTPDKTVKPGSLAAWVACARPKTWLIAVSPVLVGLLFALAETKTLDITTAAATLLIAVLMQVISNMENDAGYTKRKAERSTRKGLPRATANAWLTVKAVENAIRLLALVAVLDTAFLVYKGGWVFILICLASVIAAYCYMGGPRPIAYTPFGEAVVFIFFGITAVCGTFYLQTLSLNTEVVIASAALGLQAAAVLAVNNFRDLEHDASVGRKTLAVLLGHQGMLTAYRVLILAPYALIALLIAIEPSYWPCLLGAVTVFSALKLARDLGLKKGLELNDVMFGTIKLELRFAVCLMTGALVTFLLTNGF